MLLKEGTTSKGKEKVPVLGFLQSQAQEKSGRVVVYGDSNCLDNSHLSKGTTYIAIKEVNNWFDFGDCIIAKYRLASCEEYAKSGKCKVQRKDDTQIE